MPMIEAILMILPLRFLSIGRVTALVQLNAPFKFTLITASHSASDIRKSKLSLVMPALLTNISTFVNLSRIKFRTSSTLEKLVTSISKASDLVLKPSISALVSFAFSKSTSLITTSAPSFAKAMAISLPIP